MSMETSAFQALLGPVPVADKVSFTRDIFPVLERLTGYQWVSRRAQRGHSPGKAGAFMDLEFLRLLSDPEAAEVRLWRDRSRRSYLTDRGAMGWAVFVMKPTRP